ncbi:DNA mismatch repair endonuclease MutL [Rossellomorea aquimaris]|uniref:DNA mismatch repair protein MutL n=1 Tax=Rossellomorea aquimaris TaxID=189382 RepID=A0A1J6X1V3_9BACI|nr:DNA mismatch repair endonuclease MutL [Rossellomorea aquimaris]OIU72105.1 DNA mismatch repair protein MutL [Rossellomorea aquimaris]
MAKIFQLDDSLSNKIAAGEVVERPASVVKELLENSIDANGDVIELHIEEAGLNSIRIIDNGDGIEEEDVKTAFRRHATSKIKDENDLFRIRTLGFRGEALPSIASVSHFTMSTSTGEGPGTFIELHGGVIKKLEKTSSRKGTDITVSQIFYNTPARLKYLKTIHTELGNISDVVNRIALAHPEVSIRLLHNGKSLLHTNGSGDVRQVLAAIYGIGIAKKMIPIEVSTLDFRVSGYVSLPEVTRASRNYISTMINGRFIKNYALAKAIGEGYHTLLPIGRHPIVLLNIEMDPVIIDVNVHPSKMEVRISKENELNSLVTEGIKAVFKQKELIPSGTSAARTQKPKSEQTYMSLDHSPASVNKRTISWTMPEEALPKENAGENEAREFPQMAAEERRPFQAEIPSEDIFHEEERAVEPAEDAASDLKPKTEDPEKETESLRVPPLYPVGQMHGTYIFAQNDQGLYIIDQHAAQERIKYEFFKEKVGQVAKELQELLVPLTLEYSMDEYIKINENRSALEEVGIFLEEFGLNSFIVRSHPQWFPPGEEEETIEDMIQQVLKMNRVDIRKLREEAAIIMSCKGSIKANHHLRNDEILALLDELRRTNDPFTCPHGRPIIIHYSTYEMEKMFKRIM